MNKIDIVTPTMWRLKNFTNYLKSYCACDYIQNIFLIDNDNTQRPKDEIFNNPKIKIIDYGKNIYVNPAWNEGYYRSRADVLCFLNDDIFVENDIFKQMSILDFSSIDIIGVHLKGSVDNYHIIDHPDKKEELVRLKVDKNQPIGGQAYAFGVCMFIKRTSYKVIPSLYQIWYGDDYLIQNNENIFALKTSKIKGEISKTIVNLTQNKKSIVQKRIDLDTINAYKFNHFRNAKNWDILIKKMPKQYKSNLTNLTLYCNSFNGKLPLHTQFNQKTLMCGSYFLNKETKNQLVAQDCILDDSLTNISHLNKILGDLTGLYWVWKNSDHEFVGTNQYRRFYDERHLDKYLPLDTKTLYISQFIECKFNIWDQYIASHGDIGIKILQDAVNHKKIPFTTKMIDKLYTEKLVSPCNMFFAHKELFDKVCKILFEIIFELYNGTKYSLNHIQDNIHTGRGPNDKRLLAFLAERILNVIYYNNRYFFDNIKIQPINYATIH